MEAATKTFFTSKYFAVAGECPLPTPPLGNHSPLMLAEGASQSPHKFGYKVLDWYHARSLPVQPITPSRPSISLPGTTYQTLPSPSALPHPKETSLSIITQPSVTRQVLREAKEAGVPAVWLQPGSFDDEGLEYAETEFQTGIGGQEGAGGEGWCVLVDGDEYLSAAREESKGKL